MRAVFRLATAAVIVAAPMLVLAGPASAADRSIHVDPNPVAQGQDITFSGSGCIASDKETHGLEQVVISTSDDSYPIVTVPNDNGDWTVTATVNEAADLQDYTIYASCDLYTDSFDYTPATVSVIAPSTEGPAIKIVGYSGTPFIEQGASVKIMGSGFQAGEKVSVVLHSSPVVLATWIADGDGAVSGVVTIPQDTEIGAHSITLTGEISGLTASENIVVIAPTGTTQPTTPVSPIAPPSLASTGVNASSMTIVGLSLAALGGGALILARRRTAGDES